MSDRKRRDHARTWLARIFSTYYARELKGLGWIFRLGRITMIGFETLFLITRN